MMRKQPFARFERLAQRLVDGTFRPLFGGHTVLQSVGAALARALEDESQGGRAPNEYEVALHPADHRQVFQADADVVARLSEYLEVLAGQAGLELPEQPVVLLLSDARVSRGVVQVQARHRAAGGDSTQVQNRPARLLMSDLRAADAFLVIDGGRHVALNRPVLTLGRRADNDIVLPVSSVSREHAQIRWRFGRFVIYDLGSRAGTLVNGEPVSECVLHPGDIVTLSTVKLVYGEGEGDTGPRPQRDGATAVLPPLDDQD